MTTPTRTTVPAPTATYESTAARQRRQDAEAIQRAKIAALLRAGKLPYEISAIMGWDNEEETQDG